MPPNPPQGNKDGHSQRARHHAYASNQGQRRMSCSQSVLMTQDVNYTKCQPTRSSNLLEVRGLHFSAVRHRRDEVRSSLKRESVHRTRDHIMIVARDIKTHCTQTSTIIINKPAMTYRANRTGGAPKEILFQVHRIGHAIQEIIFIVMATPILSTDSLAMLLDVNVHYFLQLGTLFLEVHPHFL